MASIAVTTANTQPNSSIKYGVLPVLVVIGVKKPWINKLWLACSITPVHKLFDFKRNQVNTKLILITITVKQISPYQGGVPLL